MYKILKKEALNPTVTKMVIDAPLIAQKAEPGQFIIFRAKEDSERIPLTIADFDRKPVRSPSFSDRRRLHHGIKRHGRGRMSP